MKTSRILLCSIAVIALMGARRRAVEAPSAPPQTLLLERSFAITEKSILAGFTLDRVVGALIARSVAPATTAEQFVRQMFDTQNPKPGLDASMPHCDDFLLDGKPAFNGYLRRCPTLDGTFATQPFDPADYTPTAIVNGFDMADPGGANCGQYRISFGRRFGTTGDVVNLIFEAGLPNPTPAAGIGGCRPIAQFWADLSAVHSLAERRTRLERFFFDGVAGFPPAIHPDHYRDGPNGIRTFQHRPPTQFLRFYQFRVVNECRDGVCRLFARTDVLENFPSSRLFDGSDTSERTVRFREAFVASVQNLAIGDVNRYFMAIPDEFLMAENNNGENRNEFLYQPLFQRSSGLSAGRAFKTRIEEEVAKTGSTITTDDVMQRASTQNCEGCHNGGPVPVGGNVVFPEVGLTSEHVSRNRVEKGEEGEGSRFAISPAMRDVFIPNRMRILKEFLASGKPPERSQ